ncbi:NAD(P)/FAD-dependent oxidoreductase [Oligoflexus tunisiensis]|uniref:NAD(P)/FAD-dependent oxidoreductase n=1 Tax=Oligoflexus tunisiensis TaxID=708132 RepID=UPI00159F0B2F|nr:NAD(P)/FAD-dependent oxidoreductase [Oligoflexus tunisiensis]
MRKQNFFDVIIVGGGPAGLSAALVLGRACRTVLLCDSNQPRNWASKSLHGFIALDGLNPRELVRKGREQLAALGTVTFWDDEVVSGHRWQNEFEIMMKDGRTASGRKLLLATGVTDELPPIPGAVDFFGRSVFQCPYCDGWETRGKPTAIYGRGARGFTMVRALFGWTQDLVLCTDGPSGLLMRQKKILDGHGIAVREEPIECLEGQDGKLQAIRFRNGDSLPRDFLFFNLPCTQKSGLAESLGCEFTDNGGVKTGHYEATNIPGLYVAGNMIKDVHLAVVAAAEGTRAALGINKALGKENFALAE